LALYTGAHEDQEIEPRYHLVHDATDAEVEGAARRACAHDFIVDQPGGYDAQVAERGVKLSGGQRQRIGIARVILKEAPLLVLDEATSSLDSVTEHAIQSAPDEAMGKKTAIVIAHRLSTIAHLDRILVFESGRIVEDGSHAELLARDGTYRKLWSRQTRYVTEARDAVNAAEQAKPSRRSIADYGEVATS
jgi:ATP-binding cassette subfamily B protein